MGPVADVNAAIAAGLAEQAPVVDDPTIVVGVDPDFERTKLTVVDWWFRWEGTYGSIKMQRHCAVTGTETTWSALGPGPDGTVAVQVTAADLLPGAHAQVVRSLPTPLPRIGPADEDDHGYTYVNNRTFFWVDQTDGQWNPVTATASAAGIAVTAVAAPVNLRIDPGDGHEPVTCAGAPVAVTRATYRPDVEGCSYTYTDSSAMAPNGKTFPVTVGIVWHVTWSATTGEGGDLGYVSTTSDTRHLPVAESQAIVVAQNP